MSHHHHRSQFDILKPDYYQIKSGLEHDIHVNPIANVYNTRMTGLTVTHRLFINRIAQSTYV